MEMGIWKYLYGNELESTSRSNAVVYWVRLSPIGLANVTELLPFLSSPSSRTVSQSGSMAEAISAMKVAVTQTPNASSTIVSGSRNCKFFPLNHGSENLDVGLIAIRGYYSDVRGCTTRMLVKFYPSVTLTELIRRSNKSHSRESLQEFLKGLKVMTNYTKDDDGVTRPRIHTIRGFPRHLENDDPGTATNTRFPCQELSLTSDVTVRDFFSRSGLFSWLNYMQGGLQTLTEREIKLDDPSAAVVDVGFQDNPTYFPSELCHVVEGQRYGKKLSARHSDNARAITDEGMKILGMNSENPVLVDNRVSLQVITLIFARMPLG